MRPAIPMLCIQALWVPLLTGCGGGGGGGGVPFQPPVEAPAETGVRAPSYFTYSPWPNDTAPTLVDPNRNSGGRVTNVTSDNMGGWHVSFLIGGRQGSLHLTSEHADPSSRQWENQFGDLYVNLGFAHDFDHFDIVRVFADYDGDEISGAYIHGDPTPAVDMPLGTAAYTGSLRFPSFHTYFDTGQEEPWHASVSGDITLTIDFADNGLTGSVDNVRIDPRGPAPRQAHPGTEFTISGGTIVQNAFSARAVGSGYFSGFTGDVTGAFYGPDADEAGGVITAQRGPNDVFAAPFGTNQTELSVPYVPDTAAVTTALARHSDLVLDALAAAARSTPSFGSVAQSSNTRILQGTADRVTTTFDGDRLSVDVARPNRPDLRFGVSGFSGATFGRTLTTTDSSATLSWLHVRPADSASSTQASAADYLALGSWAHLTGDLDTLRIDRVEIGTFADVADAVPPISHAGGRATYTGTAAGVYAVRYGSGYDDIPRGSFEQGTFEGPARLTATFNAGVDDPPGGSIGGCIGCGGQVAIDGVYENADTGKVETVKIRSRDFAIAFLPVAFNERGEFTGEYLAVDTPYFSRGSVDTDQYAGGVGTWGGVLYGRNRSPVFGHGFPGWVKGTFGAEAELSDGTRGGILGSFSGEQSR